MLLFILPKSPLFDISSGKNNVSCCLLLRGGSGVPICLFPSDKLLELRLLCWRWGWMGGGGRRGEDGMGSWCLVGMEFQFGTVRGSRDG